MFYNFYKAKYPMYPVKYMDPWLEITALTDLTQSLAD